MKTESRTVVFAAPGTVEIQKELLPHEGVPVRTTLCGISAGTEMLFYRGPFPQGNDLETLGVLGKSDYPIAYGYMATGMGPHGRVFAFHPHRDFFHAPEETLIPIPDDIQDDDAIFFPSVETALQIVHDAAPRLGESVAVFGLGVIGLLTARLLRSAGVHVVGTDPLPGRRARAAELGFAAVDPLSESAGEEIRTACDGGPDIAVNISGSSDALQMGIDTVRAEGTVVEASWYGAKRADLALGSAFHRRRLTIRASQVSHLNPRMKPRWDRKRRTKTVWDLIRDLGPSQFITHRFALDDAAAAYRTIDQEPDGVLQIVLVP